MITNNDLEYVKNTAISLLLAVLVFLPFYWFFGNTLAIWSVIIVIGMPHIIIATLGYFVNQPKKIIIPFIAATIFGLILTVIYYRVLPNEIAPMFFLTYFIWHLLTNEQMFESTIKGGYRKWQNSWPLPISWGSILFILLVFVIAALYRSRVNFLFTLLPLVLLALLLFLGLVYAINKQRATNNIPKGFILFFIIILLPIILILSLLWKGEIFAPPMILVLFHFISWYVFYAKRLAKFPKKEERTGFGQIIFSWRKGIKQFWIFVGCLQLVWIILFLLYLYKTPLSTTASFLVSPYWAPFWTIIHITTSFLPKPGIQVPLIFKDLRTYLKFSPKNFDYSDYVKLR